MPPKPQRVHHTQGMPAIVGRHGLEQALRLRAQNLARLSICQFARLNAGPWSSPWHRELEPRGRGANKLANTIDNRHVLLTQKQSQQGIDRRPHDSAQQVKADEPAKG